jgi:uncharacterized membrane protein YeaQ/YmgE (transglycosylase-associated protein family)
VSIAWTLLYVIACGLAIGAGGRWLVPGPDPMPAWLTSAIGIAGSFVGAGTVVALAGVPETAGDAYSLVWSAIGASLGASALLVVVYRRTVQGRPIRGREAWRMPTRGIGVARARARLGMHPSPATRRHDLESVGVPMIVSESDAESAEEDWGHVADLHVGVRVRERRAVAVVVVAVAGLVAHSTRLHTFEGQIPALVGWLAWGTFLVALVASAGPLTPGREDALWETLTLSELQRHAGQAADADATRAARVSAQLRTQIARLRRSSFLGLALTVLALGLTAVAYLLDS